MQHTPITLEQQLADLCKANGLEALSVEMHLRKDGTFFVSSYAHASDDERRFCGGSGSKGYRALTASAAISDAIAALNAKRIPDLAPMGEAA